MNAIRIDTFLEEGNLEASLIEDTNDVLDQAARALDKSYVHEDLGQVLLVGEDGNVYTVTAEVNIQILDAAHVQEILDNPQHHLSDIDPDEGFSLPAELAEKLRLHVQRHTVPTELKCPMCGNDDPAQFRYMEDIENWRQVLRVEEDGTVVIHGFYRSGEGYDDGTNRRFQCHADISGPDEHWRPCLHEFPVGDIKHDFV